jgi:diadenosine tetraphosphatase ApaH/serine/threonine PP2A family protein phosphatase
MRTAVLSDIHANWPALEAVLADARASQVDEVLCLGDVVGYGGHPGRCLDQVREEGWLTLVGNHDAACTDPRILSWFNEDAARVIRWTIEQLSEDRLGWLGELPDRTLRSDVLLVHASPRDPIYEYILDTRTAAANLELLDGRVCFHGHTHVPGVFRPEEGGSYHRYALDTIELTGPALVNPGSVGQPRDGIPDASYGIWDDAEGTFEFRRIPYDRQEAKEAILSAGLPERFALRLDLGR